AARRAGRSPLGRRTPASVNPGPPRTRPTAPGILPRESQCRPISRFHLLSQAPNRPRPERTHGIVRTLHQRSDFLERPLLLVMQKDYRAVVVGQPLQSLPQRLDLFLLDGQTAGGERVEEQATFAIG